MHDFRIFRHSPISDIVERSDVSYFYNKYHLIGDGAYHLSKSCMVPYTDYGNLSAKQRNFNKKLCQTRQIIERAFGQLKERFRRLKGINVNTVEKVSYTICAACVLHNICIFQNDVSFDYPANDLEDNIFTSLASTTADGRTKRNQIADLLDT